MLIILSILFSGNPFSDKISPNIDNFTKSSALLTREDQSQYLTYEETHKVVNPDSFFFLSYQAKFIAYKSDSLGDITSIVLYISDYGDLISMLEKEFGKNNSSFSVTGEMTGIKEQLINYETLAWRIKNSIMMVSPSSTSVATDQRNLGLTRIWIKELK